MQEALTELHHGHSYELDELETDAPKMFLSSGAQLVGTWDEAQPGTVMCFTSGAEPASQCEGNSTTRDAYVGSAQIRLVMRYASARSTH